MIFIYDDHTLGKINGISFKAVIKTARLGHVEVIVFDEEEQALRISCFSEDTEMMHTASVAISEYDQAGEENRSCLIAPMVSRLFTSKRGMTYKEADRLAPPITKDIIEALSEFIKGGEE